MQRFRKKDNKSELCTSTAEEVLHSLRFRSEGSGAKQCNGFERKISKSELCTSTAEEVLFLLCFRSEGSGAKQISGSEGEISKSELFTGTAEEVLYLLCFRSEGSGAKQCSCFEGKISKSELRTGTAAELRFLLCFRTFSRAKYCIHPQIAFTVFEKAQPSKVWYLQCFRRLRLAKHGIYCVWKGIDNVLKGSSAQCIVFTVFEKAQARKAWYSLCFRRLRRAKLCFRRLRPAKYGQSSSASAVDVSNLERELIFGAKPRAGAHVWSRTSSGSSCLEPNLEREPRLFLNNKLKNASESTSEGAAEQSWILEISTQTASATRARALPKAQSSKVGF